VQKWYKILVVSNAYRLNSNSCDSTHRSMRKYRSTLFVRWRQCALPSDTCFLEPARVFPLNGISIDSSVLAGPTVMTDAETNRNSDRLLSVKTCVGIGWIYSTLATRPKSTGNCNELSRQLHTWQLNKTASPTAEVSRCRRCLRPLPIIVTTRRWLLLTGIICDFMLMFCSDLRSREPLSSLVE